MTIPPRPVGAPTLAAVRRTSLTLCIASALALALHLLALTTGN